MIEETREKTLLIPPPDVVPMWCQLKESGDYCGFMITKKSEPSWRVANHGSFQLNKDLAAHHPVYMRLSEAQTVERSIRSETAKSYKKQRGKKRNVKEEGRN